MTIDEAIEEAAKLDGWYLEEGRIRREYNDVTCCPLTCGLGGRDPRTMDEFEEEAVALGLTMGDDIRIAVAADNCKKHSHFIPELRVKMLAALEPG